MAQMHPTILDPDTKSTAERRLYEAFESELDDNWVIFHHVKWIAYDEMGRPRDGEADFVISHAQLGVFVLEVKGGRIHFDSASGHFVSTDRKGNEHNIKDPFEQATNGKYTLIYKLRGTDQWPKRRVVFGHAVAFPDAVAEPGWVRPNAPREIIIDALDLKSLERRLVEILTFWQGQSNKDSPPGENALKVMVRVLSQVDSIRHPLLAEGARADEQTLVRLTERQYRYLWFLKGQRRAAIAGCAGSGKTFLAIEKARQLVSDGLKVLFICYNRALADQLGQALGYSKQFDVFSFHQMCVRLIEDAGQKIPPDQDANHNYFITTLPNALLSALDIIGPRYDAIVVDEGQDFREEWWGVLPWLMQDPTYGIMYVFYDDNQRVYSDRSAIPIESEPYQLNENCRNTKRIFDVVNRFYTGSQPIISLGPSGQRTEFISYDSFDAGEKELRRLLHRLINVNGFKNDEIAVLTPLSKKNSSILGLRLGNVELSDRLPIASNEVFATTIRRFKGLERPVVVLCEVDARMSEEQAEQLIYVGTSRARTLLIILIGQNAPPFIQQELKSLDS
jgi:hypothetical protein